MVIENFFEVRFYMVFELVCFGVDVCVDGYYVLLWGCEWLLVVLVVGSDIWVVVVLVIVGFVVDGVIIVEGVVYVDCGYLGFDVILCLFGVDVWCESVE